MHIERHIEHRHAKALSYHEVRSAEKRFFRASPTGAITLVMQRLLFALVFLAACGGTQSETVVPAPAVDGPPVAKRVLAKSSYHGVEVSEHYRWLENWDNPEVKAWAEGQNAYAQRYLDARPQFASIRERVAEIEDAPSVGYWKVQIRESAVFAMKYQPPTPLPFLVVMPSEDATDKARVLIDPTKVDKNGLTSIDWYVPSPDGTLVAASLSSAGTELGDLHIFDVATGKRVHEIIERVNGGTAGGNLAWTQDNKGFYYTRYPRPDERPAEELAFYVRVHHHALGADPKDDRYVIGKEFPRIAEIELSVKDEILLVTVQNGDGGEFAHYLRGRDGTWKQFSEFGDRVVQAIFGPRDDLYLLSYAGAPRGKVLRTTIADLNPAAAKVVIREGEGAIPNSFWSSPSLLPTKTRLYVTEQHGGPSVIKVYDLEGKPLKGPTQDEVASVGSLTWHPSRGDSVLLNHQSFVKPGVYFRFDPSEKTTTATALARKPPLELGDVEVRREFATSKDGTKVPLNIILPKGIKLDGSHPCIATGYGGYGISLSPRYSTDSALGIEQGVIRVVANLRGGGEYGEQWHLQGNLTKKQNVFDDLIAVLQHLVDRGYTSKDRLAIIGGSNGGLLMGAVVTQRPDLVKAVASYVGIYDQLRTELSPNGEFNVTEFGTVKIKEQFEAMHAYSPYHRVKKNTRYPATLFHAGANDPRVSPWQSRKMAAAMQHAQAGDAPILLRTDSESGHGGSTKKDARIHQSTQVWAFLFEELGVTFKKKRPEARALSTLGFDALGWRSENFARHDYSRQRN